MSVGRLDRIDSHIVAFDATKDMSKLGAQMSAAVSLGAAVCAARSLRRPLFLHFASEFHQRSGGLPKTLFLPRPVVTLFGAEPRWLGRVRLREICLIPDESAVTSCASLREFFAAASRIGDEFIKKNSDDLTAHIVDTSGGIRYTNFDSLQHCVEVVEEAIKDAQLVTPAPSSLRIGIVVDGSLCFKPETQKYALIEGSEITGGQLAEMIAALCKEKKVISYVEDVHHENDVTEMQRLMARIGDTCVIAGNNVYAGNLDNVTRGIDKKLTNACVVRMNDCGTVSKTMEVARTFLNYKGASVVVAGEAVEGQGAQLADLAVGVGARYIRCGGMLRADHVAGVEPSAFRREGTRSSGLAGAATDTTTV